MGLPRRPDRPWVAITGREGKRRGPGEDVTGARAGAADSQTPPPVTTPQNGRATFSFSAIEAADARELQSADFLLILNRNENIIPAVAKLNAEQAAAYFMLGETQGTSAGGAEEAGKFLREANLRFLDYVGFVEADAIGQGAADVIVTEGFAGNIAIKTAEGTARQITDLLRAAMGRTLRAKLGYLLAREAFRTLRDKLDPRKANGGVFLGLNGIVIKSHGGTDAEGFAAAVDVGYDMVRYELLNKIKDTLLRHAREEAEAREEGEAAEASEAGGAAS